MRPSLTKEDERDLKRVIAKAIELANSDDEKDNARAETIALKAFEDMLARGRPLSTVQASWLRKTVERLFDEPTYENLASGGKLCIGRPVPTPDILRRENLPLKPPQRRASHGDKEKR